jgi:hypothetical protein
MVLEGAQDKVKALPPSLQAQARTQALRAPPEKAITEGMKEFAARNLVGKPAGRRKASEILPTIEECRPPAKQQKAASSKGMPAPVPKPKPGTVACSSSPAPKLLGQELSAAPPVPKAPSFKAAPASVASTTKGGPPVKRGVFNMSLLNDDRSRSRTKPAAPQVPSKSRPSSVSPKPKPPELEGPPKPVAPVLVGWEPEVKQQAPPVSKIVEMNQKRKAAEEPRADDMEVEEMCDLHQQAVPAPSLAGSADSVSQPPLCVTSTADEERRKEFSRVVTEMKGH